jgi:signal transduction histidine kinase
MTTIEPFRRLDQGLLALFKGVESLISPKAVHLEGQAPALRCVVTDTGIGLELVICQKLIELMAGRFGIDSTSGKGSMFWFELPLRTTA